jgi:hypothetical protein
LDENELTGAKSGTIIDQLAARIRRRGARQPSLPFDR